MYEDLIYKILCLRSDSTTLYNRGINCGLEAACNIIREDIQSKHTAPTMDEIKTHMRIQSSQQSETVIYDVSMKTEPIILTEDWTVKPFKTSEGK